MKLWDVFDGKIGVFTPARPGEDYGVVLKRRRVFAAVMTLFSLLCFAFYLLWVRSGSFSDFTKGFYFGVSLGLMIGSLVLHWRLSYLKRHPEAQKRAQVGESDERERVIVQKALQFAAVVVLVLGVAAMLILAAVDLHAFFAVLVMFAALCLAFLGGYLYYCRIM